MSTELRSNVSASRVTVHVERLTLDVESVDIEIRVFPLEHADAVEVHQQMTQLTMQVLGQIVVDITLIPAFEIQEIRARVGLAAA